MGSIINEWSGGKRRSGHTVQYLPAARRDATRALCADAGRCRSSTEEQTQCVSGNDSRVRAEAPLNRCTDMSPVRDSSWSRDRVALSSVAWWSSRWCASGKHPVSESPPPYTNMHICSLKTYEILHNIWAEHLKQIESPLINVTSCCCFQRTSASSPYSLMTSLLENKQSILI